MQQQQQQRMSGSAADALQHTQGNNSTCYPAVCSSGTAAQQQQRRLALLGRQLQQRGKAVPFPWLLGVGGLHYGFGQQLLLHQLLYPNSTNRAPTAE
jgi:hypothetical protein